jgi:hypothetical protein
MLDTQHKSLNVHCAMKAAFQLTQNGMMDLRDEYEFRPYNMQNDILSKNFHNEII